MRTGVAFSDQTIRVAIDGNGIVHMDIPSGEDVFTMAFPVSQLIKNIAACNRAVAEWQKRERRAKVVRLRPELADLG